MRARNLDLVVVMCIVVINVIWAMLPNRPLILGIIFGLPLTFFLSGYALTQVLFRRRVVEQTPQASNALIRRPDLKLGRQVDGSDQLLLGFGLSMAIDVVVGFGLNFLPAGLQGSSWVIALGLVTTALIILAVILRRRDLPEGTTIAARVHITPQDGILFGLAIAIVASSVWLSVIRPATQQSSFTQFWMLPANQSTQSCAVSIGIQSFETATEHYRVVVMVNRGTTHEWSPIVLSPQQKWVQFVPVTPGTGSSVAVEAMLYRSEQPTTMYRDVHLTFYIASTGQNGATTQQCRLHS